MNICSFRVVLLLGGMKQFSNDMSANKQNIRFDHKRILRDRNSIGNKSRINASGLKRMEKGSLITEKHHRSENGIQYPFDLRKKRAGAGALSFINGLR
jgi:hypothetical protein